MGVLPAYMPVHRTAMPIGDKGGHLTLMKWSYSWLGAIVKVLGTKSVSSAGTASALSHGTSLQALRPCAFCFCFCFE